MTQSTDPNQPEKPSLSTDPGAAAAAPDPTLSSTDSDPGAPEAPCRAAPPLEPAADGRPFAIGERVCLVRSPRYLKTAEPMPMLRPPDLVDPGESGVVSEIRGRDQLAVRFRRGCFLLSCRDLRSAPEQEGPQG